MSSSIIVVKNGRKYEVQIDGETVSTHKTKAAAQAECQAEIDARIAENTPGPVEFVGDPTLVSKRKAPMFKAVAVGAYDSATDTVVIDHAALEALAEQVAATLPVDYATMDRLERLALARTEKEAITAWKATKTGTPPATPCLDWMLNPANDAARKSTPRKGTTATVARTPEQDALIRTAIIDGRAAGASWAKVATAIDALGIPTARGGKWYDTTAHDLAKKLGIADFAPQAQADVA